MIIVNKENIVEHLLDAAFRELQHDTGPQDREYRHQREQLRKEFTRLIRPLQTPAQGKPDSGSR